MRNEDTFFCLSTTDYTECVESLDPFQDCSARLSTIALLVAQYASACDRAEDIVTVVLPGTAEVYLDCCDTSMFAGMDVAW